MERNIPEFLFEVKSTSSQNLFYKNHLSVVIQHIVAEGPNLINF